MTSFPYDTIVTVLVGPEKDCFAIHKTLVCDQSSFFKAALTGNFKEADGTIALPEQDAAAFKYFVHWLYTDSLRGLFYPKSSSPTMAELRDLTRTELNACNISTPDQLPYKNHRRIVWERAQYRDLPFYTLIPLYILADALLVQALKDDVITALIEVYGLNSPEKTRTKIFWDTDEPECLKKTTRSINMAWEASPKGSNLCQLLVQLFCDNTPAIGDYCAEEQLHPEFVVAACGEYAERWLSENSTTQWTTTEAICFFHEHEGDTCALSKRYLEDQKSMASG